MSMQTIHYAAQKGDINALKAELSKGVNVDSLDGDRDTPLHNSAIYGKLKAVKFLVEQKATVDMPNNNGATPLHYACREGHAAVASFLLDAKADINKQKSDGFTPLIFVACCGHEDCAKLLLERNADATIKDNDSKPALDYAKEYNRDKLVALLQQHDGALDKVQRTAEAERKRVEQARIAKAKEEAERARKQAEQQRLEQERLAKAKEAERQRQAEEAERKRKKTEDEAARRAEAERQRLEQERIAKEKAQLVASTPVASMTVDQVCDWLASINLAKHAAKFRENDVDGRLLLKLTPDELKIDLGVASGLEIKKIESNLEKLKEQQNAQQKANASAAADKETLLNVGAHLSEQMMYLTDKVKQRQAATAAAAASSPDSKSDRSQLQIIEYEAVSQHMTLLASGQFGDVYLSRWQNRQVVVKRPRVQDAGVNKELAAFHKLPRHDRICPLLGACLDPVCFVSPFLKNGSLKQLLNKTREKKLSAAEQSAIDVTKAAVVLSLAVDLCEAMCVIHKAGLVHRDIAARNVLLDEKWRPVLTDFGMCRAATSKNASSTYYKGGGNEPLPVCWMSPEAITNDRFSIQSDVFAFAVTLWEVLNVGANPYNFGKELRADVPSGKLKLSFKSASCPPALASLLEKCISLQAEQRPTSAELLQQLQQLQKSQ